jgi:hypothetical protein
MNSNRFNPKCLSYIDKLDCLRINLLYYDTLLLTANICVKHILNSKMKCLFSNSLQNQIKKCYAPAHRTV